MEYLIKQSSTATPLLFLMVSSDDHLTGVTGLSPTVTISKNGGSFGSPSGGVTELGNGWYRAAGNATDTNTLGPLVLHATATGADPCDACYGIVAFDPHSATNLGLSALAAIGTLTADERNAAADALLDRVSAIDGKTPKEAMRIMAAVLAGKITDAGTGTETFVGLDGSTTRVVVTVDSTGNRTAVEYRAIAPYWVIWYEWGDTIRPPATARQNQQIALP